MIYVSFIRSLYSKSIPKFFTFCSRRRIVWPAVALLFLYVKRMKKAGDKKNAVNILVFQKQGLNEDISESLASDKRVNLYTVHRRAIKAMAVGILHHSLDDNNYSSVDESVNRTKLEYADYLGSVWDKARKLIRMDAAVVGNFAYYAERELGTALEQRGVPFVALHKESLKTPGRLEFFHRVYKERRGPFTGRKIIVYNDIERELQVSAGVISEDRVSTAGMPRMDRAHRFRVSERHDSDSAHTAQVLFFSFGKRTGLPLLARKEKTGHLSGYERVGGGVDELNWDRLFRHCHEAVILLARDNPHIRVVVKAKGSVRESRALAEGLFSSSTLPPNLRIEVGGDPHKLIAQSSVVCGFNTTALLESIAMGKPVVVPLFEEALEEKMKPYIIDLENAVRYARSREELIALFSQYATDGGPSVSELNPDHKRVLDKWVGNSDGRSGERVRDVLISTVMEGRTPHGRGC